MKLALVGIGSAGGRIVDRIHDHETATERDFSAGNTLVFDTAAPNTEFEPLVDDRLVTFGETYPEVGEHGVDGDADLARRITREELPEIRRALDRLELHSLDGLLVVAGLGGGTGSGMGAVLLEELQALFETPVYALGVLPRANEDDNAALNAARSLQSFVSTADNVILFDNESWSSADDESTPPYQRENAALATRIIALMATGERANAKIPENAIDSSDIRRTLETGGVSSIGYASLDIEHGSNRLLRLLKSIFTDRPAPDPVDPNAIKRLVREAVDTNLTLPCRIDSAERTLVVVSGPSAKLSRRGFEEARHILARETETVEVLAGDEPQERSSRMTASVLLANVTNVRRIEAVQERAVAYQDESTSH